MPKKFAFVCIALLLAGTAGAGLFKNSVDLADLAQVSDESLLTLRDSEFEVFIADVRLNAARDAERRAAGGVKAAKRILEAESLDLKAAKAELKAAKANQDKERQTAANALIAAAEEDLQTATQLLKWKEQEQQAREVSVKAAKSAFDLAEAKRDLARAELLEREKAPAAMKYDPAELQSAVAKRQKEYDGASRKAQEKTAGIEKFRAEWERLAKHLVVVEEE